MYIIISIGILFIILGISVKYFKCYWLIAGYNTMSKEQKKNVDTEALGKLMGNYMFLLGATFIIGGVLAFKDLKTIGTILLIVPVFILTPYVIVKAQKYDKNSLEPDGSLKKSTKITLGVFIGLIVLIFIFVLVLLGYGAQEPKVTVEDERIKISGMYASTVPTDDIVEVVLLDSIPKVLRKHNGFDFGNILRGYFNLESIGKGRLYINNGKPPYVYIELKKGFVIINYKNVEETQNLYDRIKKVL